MGKHRLRNAQFEFAVLMICVVALATIVVARSRQETKLEEITGQTVIILNEQVNITERFEATTVDMSEVDLLCRVVWGEARGCDKEQQAAVVWCVLNRVDAGFGTIEEVIKAKGQFSGWNVHNPVINSIKEIVVDVLYRHEMEKNCIGDVGRVLPKDYLWFIGNGEVNIYRNDYSDYSSAWDWSLPNPYV